MRKFGQSLVLLCLIILCGVSYIRIAYAFTVPQETTPPIRLQVPLGDTVEVTNFVQYIEVLYRWVLGIIGILAAVMIIWGGYKWAVASGNAQIIGTAKTTIFSAAVGLAIALGSYLILYTLNPRITALDWSDVPGITAIEQNKVDNEGLATCTTQAGTVISREGLCYLPGGYTLLWPVDNAVFTSYFGYRNSNIGSKCHAGVDLSNAQRYGSPIRAAHDGVMTVAAINQQCGEYMAVIDGNGFSTRYLHLKTVNSNLLNQTVTAGTVIGTMGGDPTQSRCSNGAHLHFELYVHGVLHDPEPCLKGYETIPCGQSAPTCSGTCPGRNEICDRSGGTTGCACVDTGGF